MSTNLFEKADALMQKRSFVAGKKPVASSSPLTEKQQDDEDVPLLTERVDSHVVCHSAMPSLGNSPEFAEQLATALAEKQAHLIREMEAWLDEQMPQLVMRAMDGITDHLIALLANRARDDLLPRLDNVFSREVKPLEPETPANTQ